MSKELKPQIRFKGFEDDWQHSPFGEIATRTSHIAFDESIPCVEYEDINSKKGTLNKDITKKEIHKKGQYFIPGDLLFGKLRPYLGNNLLADFSGIAVGDFWILKNGLASTKFLYPFLYTKDFQFVSNQSTGSKMPRADWNLVSKWEFIYPSNNLEQTYIGDFFSDVDVLISESEREIGRLEKMKQASLQKMFPRPGSTTPEIRFAGFTEPWEVKELGTIAEKVSAKNRGFDYDETFSCSAEHGIINQQEFFDHNISKSNKIDGYLIVKPDYFVYNPRVSSLAPFGPIIRNKTGRTGVISPLYLLFKFNEQVDYLFLDWFFKTSYWHNFMKINGDSGARHDRFTIRTEIFFQMPILFPQIEEQRAIGEYFRNLDSVISSKRQKLSKLRQIKQACLDKMFVNATES